MANEFETMKEKFTRAKKDYKDARRMQLEMIWKNLIILIEEKHYAENFAVRPETAHVHRASNRPAKRAGHGIMVQPYNHESESGVIRLLYAQRDSLPKHDLSNWMWIPIVYCENPSFPTEKNTQTVMDVCFQTPDLDEESGNKHVVYDRISLIDGNADGFDGTGGCEDTGLELPFDEDKMGKLEQYVCERLERWCQVNGIDPKTGRHLPAED